MRNELQRHKRSDKVKWVLTGIMFFLAFIMIAGLILQVFGTGKAKPSEWFKKSDSEQTDTLPDGNGEHEAAALSLSVPLYMTKEYSATENNVAGATAQVSTYATSTDNMSFDYISYSWWQSGTLVELGNIIIDCNPSGICSDSTLLRNFQIRRYSMYGSTSYLAMFLTIESSPYELTGVELFNGSSSVSLSDNDNFWVCDLSALSDNITLKLSYSVTCPTVPLPLPPDPVKEGYTFIGWYFDEAFTRPYDDSPIFEDTKLYAKFEINTYTVTFDSDGGTEITSQTVDWGTVLTIKTPTRTGYTFTGWYLSDGTKYENQPIKSNTMLIAKWEVIMCTVSFMVDGEVYEIKQVKYGTVFTDVVVLANTLNLRVMSISLSDTEQLDGNFDDKFVSGNIIVEAQEMSDTDKAINIMKENKWAIIGGVAGGVALIAVIAAVCGGVKRKRRR